MVKFGEQGLQNENSSEVTGANFYDVNSSDTRSYPFGKAFEKQITGQEDLKNLHDEKFLEQLEDEFFIDSDAEMYLRDFEQYVSSVQETLDTLKNSLPSRFTFTNEQERAIESLQHFVNSFLDEADLASEDQLRGMYQKYYNQAENLEVIDSLIKDLQSDSTLSDTEYSSDPQEEKAIQNFFKEGDKSPEKVLKTNLVQEFLTVFDLLERFSQHYEKYGASDQILQAVSEMEQYLTRFKGKKIDTPDEVAEFLHATDNLDAAKSLIEEYNNSDFKEVPTKGSEGTQVVLNEQKLDTSVGFYIEKENSKELGFERVSEKYEDLRQLTGEVFLFFSFDSVSPQVYNAYLELRSLMNKYSNITSENFKKAEEELKGLTKQQEIINTYYQEASNQQEIVDAIFIKSADLQKAYALFERRKSHGLTTRYEKALLDELQELFDGKAGGNLDALQKNFEGLQYYLTLENTVPQEDESTNQIKELAPPSTLPAERLEQKTVVEKGLKEFEPTQILSVRDNAEKTRLQRIDDRVAEFPTQRIEGVEMLTERIELPTMRIPGFGNYDINSSTQRMTGLEKDDVQSFFNTVPENTVSAQKVESWEDLFNEPNEREQTQQYRNISTADLSVSFEEKHEKTELLTMTPSFETLPLSFTQRNVVEVSNDDDLYKIPGFGLPTQRIEKVEKPISIKEPVAHVEKIQENTEVEKIKTSLQEAFMLTKSSGEHVFFANHKHGVNPEIGMVLAFDIYQGLFSEDVSRASLLLHDLTLKLFNSLEENNPEAVFGVLNDLQLEISQLSVAETLPKEILNKLQIEIDRLKSLLDYPTDFSFSKDTKVNNYLGQIPYQCEYVYARFENAESDVKLAGNINALMGQVSMYINNTELQQEVLNTLEEIKATFLLENNSSTSYQKPYELLAQYYSARYAYERISELVHRRDKTEGKYQKIALDYRLNLFEGSASPFDEESKTIQVSAEEINEQLKNREEELPTQQIDIREFMNSMKREQVIKAAEKAHFMGEQFQKSNQIEKFNNEFFENHEQFKTRFNESMEILQAYSNHTNEELTEAEVFVEYVLKRNLNFSEDINFIQSGLDYLSEIESLLAYNRNEGDVYNTDHFEVMINGEQQIFNLDELSIQLDIWLNSLQKLDVARGAYLKHRRLLREKFSKVAALFNEANRNNLVKAMRENAKQKQNQATVVSRGPY